MRTDANASPDLKPCNAYAPLAGPVVVQRWRLLFAGRNFWVDEVNIAVEAEIAEENTNLVEEPHYIEETR